MIVHEAQTDPQVPESPDTVRHHVHDKRGGMLSCTPEGPGPHHWYMTDSLRFQAAMNWLVAAAQQLAAAAAWQLAAAAASVVG